MTDALNREPLLRALHEAGVRHIVPDPEPDNLRRLAQLLANIDARHVRLGDFDPDEFPFDTTRPEDLEGGANFRLETRLGDLDVMQWIAGIDTEPAYAALAANAISGELGGIPLQTRRWTPARSR